MELGNEDCYVGQGFMSCPQCWHIQTSEGIGHRGQRNRVRVTNVTTLDKGYELKQGYRTKRKMELGHHLC